MENEMIENGLTPEEVAPAVVEKVNLEDVRGEQAEVEFEEFMKKALSDPKLVKDAMYFIEQNKAEYEELFGPIEIQENQPQR